MFLPGDAGWIAATALQRLVLVARREFLLAVEGQEELRAVVVGRKQFSLVTNNERAAGGQFVVHAQHFMQDSASGPQRFQGVLGIAVIPPELQRRKPFAFRKLEADARGLGKSFGINARSQFALPPRWDSPSSTRGTAC